MCTVLHNCMQYLLLQSPSVQMLLKDYLMTSAIIYDICCICELDVKVLTVIAAVGLELAVLNICLCVVVI